MHRRSRPTVRGLLCLPNDGEWKVCCADGCADTDWGVMLHLMWAVADIPDTPSRTPASSAGGDGVGQGGEPGVGDGSLGAEGSTDSRDASLGALEDQHYPRHPVMVWIAARRVPWLVCCRTSADQLDERTFFFVTVPCDAPGIELGRRGRSSPRGGGGGG